MTTPRENADLAVRYFMDNTLTCWARRKNKKEDWTLVRDPHFNVPSLEYYVGHEPPPPDKHTIDNLRAQLAEAQKDAERWRWLRDHARIFRQSPDMSGNHYWMVQATTTLRGPTLDAAIDAARGEKNGA